MVLVFQCLFERESINGALYSRRKFAVGSKMLYKMLKLMDTQYRARGSKHSFPCSSRFASLGAVAFAFSRVRVKVRNLVPLFCMTSCRREAAS